MTLIKKKVEHVDWDSLRYSYTPNSDSSEYTYNSTPKMIFKSAQPFNKKSMKVLDKIENELTLSDIKDHIIPLITKKHKISVRVVDWFVKNYAKENPTFSINRLGMKINIFEGYSANLSESHRPLCDGYKRFGRTYFKVKEGNTESSCYETTVGQLHFLTWVILNNILDSAATNHDILRNHMEERRQKKRPKPSSSSSSEKEDGDNTKDVPNEILENKSKKRRPLVMCNRNFYILTGHNES